MARRCEQSGAQRAPRWVALGVAAVLGVVSSGCIAFQSYGALPDPDSGRRRSAIRTRGIIAASVGIVEMAIAGAVLYGMSRGLEPSGGEITSENPAGAAVQGFSNLGSELLAFAFVGGIGALAGISGIGDVTCGAQDLLGIGGCDGIVRALNKGTDDEERPRGKIATIRDGATPRAVAARLTHEADGRGAIELAPVGAGAETGAVVAGAETVSDVAEPTVVDVAEAAVTPPVVADVAEAAVARPVVARTAANEPGFRLVAGAARAAGPETVAVGRRPVLLRQRSVPTIEAGRRIGPFAIGMSRDEVWGRGLPIAAMGPRTACVASEADATCTYRLRFDGDTLDRIAYELSSSTLGVIVAGQPVAATARARTVAERLGCAAIGVGTGSYQCDGGLMILWRTDNCARRLGDGDGTACRSPRRPGGAVTIVQGR